MTDRSCWGRMLAKHWLVTSSLLSMIDKTFKKSEITWHDPKNYSIIVAKMKRRCRKTACGTTASPTGWAENCNLLKSIRGKYRWETFGSVWLEGNDDIVVSRIMSYMTGNIKSLPFSTCFSPPLTSRWLCFNQVYSLSCGAHRNTHAPAHMQVHAHTLPSETSEECFGESDFFFFVTENQWEPLSLLLCDDRHFTEQHGRRGS